MRTILPHNPHHRPTPRTCDGAHECAPYGHVHRPAARGSARSSLKSVHRTDFRAFLTPMLRRPRPILRLCDETVLHRIDVAIPHRRRELFFGPHMPGCAARAPPVRTSKRPLDVSSPSANRRKPQNRRCHKACSRFPRRRPGFSPAFRRVEWDGGGGADCKRGWCAVNAHPTLAGGAGDGECGAPTLRVLSLRSQRLGRIAPADLVGPDR